MKLVTRSEPRTWPSISINTAVLMMVVTLSCFQDSIFSPAQKVSWILQKETWKSQVVVGCLHVLFFSPNESPDMSVKQQSAAADAAGNSSHLTSCTKDRGFGYGKRRNNSPCYSPMLRKLSDKVLLNFFIFPIFSAGWEAGIRSHISLVSFSLLRLWRRTGTDSGVWMWFWRGEEGEGRPVEFKERSGASPALLPLLQRTGTDRKPEAGVRHSLLSSTPQKQLSSGDFLKIVTTFPREREKNRQ